MEVPIINNNLYIYEFTSILLGRKGFINHAKSKTSPSWLRAVLLYTPIVLCSRSNYGFYNGARPRPPGKKTERNCRSHGIFCPTDIEGKIWNSDGGTSSRIKHHRKQDLYVLNKTFHLLNIQHIEASVLSSLPYSCYRCDSGYRYSSPQRCRKSKSGNISRV